MYSYIEAIVTRDANLVSGYKHYVCLEILAQ